MQIVFLDSASANRGDLDWKLFEDLGTIVRYDNTLPEVVAERIQEADILVVNKVRITAEHLADTEHLKLIAEMATGYDNIDLVAAKARGVTVCNVPGYATESVAQATFALLLELTHHIGDYDRSVKDGAWTQSAAFSLWQENLIGLAGKTFLVVGLGRIGHRVAEIATAFGMKVICTSILGHEHGDYPTLPLAEALAQADVVSIHCPLKPETTGMVNKEWLRHMKPTAFLINMSRGKMVNDTDLTQALRDGRLAGYATDVLSQEPPPADHPLLQAPNCIISPHIGWATKESRQKLWKMCAENIRAFSEGKPQNVVS
jgi:glycerate dehydrogenase